MDNIYLEGTDDSPMVKMDAQEGRLEFSGRSLPENVNQFFDPLIEWAEEYVKTPQEITVLSFYFDYINSSSSKKILEMLMAIRKVSDMGKKLEIIWNHRMDDEDMQEEGVDFQKMLKMNFQFIAR